MFQRILASVLILLVMYPLISAGQNRHSIDSMLMALSKTPDNPEKYMILRGLFEAYERTDIDKADSFNEVSLQLAKKINYEEGIIRSLCFRSSVLRIKGQYDSALAIRKRLTPLVRKTMDSISIADHLGDIGYLYNSKNDPKNALINLMESLRIYEIKKGMKNLSLLYNRIGSLYQGQKQYDSALHYYQRSLQINDSTGFKLGSSVNLINIGNVYEEQKDHHRAIDFYFKALKMKEEIGDKQGIIKCYNNIGKSYMDLGEVSQAIRYHEQSLNLAKEFNSNLDIAMSYINLGFDYQRGNDFKNAIKFALEGLQMSKKINDLVLLRESARVLSECYGSTRNYEEAYRYHVMFKTFSDSIVNERNLKAMKEIQARYDVANKEREITELKVSKKLHELQIQTMRAWYSLGIGLLIASLALVFIFYYRSRTSKRLSAKLSEINEMKSHFFANLSHEFRTPLTLMLGPTEKLLEKASPDDRQWLQLIHRNASRLLFLDEQLLEFTRIDSGTQKIHLVEGNILVHLESIAQSFVLYAKQKQVEFSWSFPDLPVEMPFDQDIIEKVTVNLISNALKYTAPGGKVTLKCRMGSYNAETGFSGEDPDGNPYFKIDVTDTGTGIPLSKRGLIFERFYQLNHHPGNTVGGVGIGLALTKELLSLHRGAILLDSVEGQGSTFSVFLSASRATYSRTEIQEIRTFNPQLSVDFSPAHSKEIPGVVTIGEGEQPASDGDRNQILVVDDNSDMRLYVRNVLTNSYAVSEAGDGEEGFQIACELMPDLIVTDVMMHPMNGIEFCTRLKRDEKTSHIPVIMLTALSDLQERIEGLETGADDYITKPFSNRELLVRINNLIAQRKNLRERFSAAGTFEPKTISVTSADEKFLNRLIQVIEDNIDNPDLEIEFLLRSIAMSRSQLHRKITALTGQPITTFIRIIRIKRAAQLFEQKFGNVSDVMYAVGFNNLSYFTKSFREVYHMTPSEFMSK